MLHKAEIRLRDLIRKGVNVDENHWTGLSPLHFAVQWPIGVRLLLDAGAAVDCVDRNGSTPVFFASRWGSEVSFKMLTQAGSKVVAYSSPAEILRGSDQAPHSPLFWAVCNCAKRSKAGERGAEDRQAIFVHLVNAIATRRETLRNLALKILSRQDATRLRLLWTSILDHVAWEVYRTLTYYGDYGKPELYALQHRSLFFDVCTSWQAAHLWASGFRVIDEVDDQGMTPLHWTCYRRPFTEDELDLLQWFLANTSNASLTKIDPKWNIIHFLAAGLMGEYGGHLIEAAKLAAHAGVSPLACDNCSCACSQKGCTPTTVGFSTCSWPMEEFPRWAIAVCRTPKEMKQLWRDFARTQKFMRLGLTHTCFRPWPRTHMSEEDILEIQEEESGMIEALEIWMDQYDTEFGRNFNFANVNWEGGMERLDELLGRYDGVEYHELVADVHWQLRQQNRDRVGGRPVKMIEHQFREGDLQKVLARGPWTEKPEIQGCA